MKSCFLQWSGKWSRQTTLLVFVPVTTSIMERRHVMHSLHT